MTRSHHLLVKETILRQLLESDSSTQLESLLARQHNAPTLRHLITPYQQAPQPSAARWHDWYVLELKDQLRPEQRVVRGWPISGLRVYSVLPDGSVKVSFSDENGHTRIELNEPGPVRFFTDVPLEPR